MTVAELQSSDWPCPESKMKAWSGIRRFSGASRSNFCWIADRSTLAIHFQPIVVDAARVACPIGSHLEAGSILHAKAASSTRMALIGQLRSFLNATAILAIEFEKSALELMGNLSSGLLMKIGFNSLRFASAAMFSVVAMVIVALCGCEPASESGSSSNTSSSNVTPAAEKPESGVANAGTDVKRPKRKKISALNVPADNGAGPTRSFAEQ